jgi:hypothetical protein
MRGEKLCCRDVVSEGSCCVESNEVLRIDVMKVNVSTLGRIGFGSVAVRWRPRVYFDVSCP